MFLAAKHPLMLTKNVYMLISRLDTNNDRPIRQPRNMSSAIQQTICETKISCLSSYLAGQTTHIYRVPTVVVK